MDGCDNSNFPGVGEGEGGDGGVDQVKDEWTDCREAAPYRSHRHAVDTRSPPRAQPAHGQNQVR